MERLQNPVTGGSPYAVQAIWPLVALAGVALLFVVDSSRLVEVSFVDFLIVTVVLGGGAAWLSGQAIAGTWRPYLQLLAYMLILAAAVRFAHYALFAGTLMSPAYFLADFVILSSFASLGYRTTRARQMATQYSWLYQRTGPLSWALRGKTAN